MRRPEYAEPFEDEDLETRAWDHYQTARDEGSLLPEDDLIHHCRQLAHNEQLALQKLGVESVAVGVDDE